MVFVLILLMQYITFIDLHMLKHPCIPGINHTWSRCMIFLMCCWILFASILLSIFASMFISDIGLSFSFFMTSLSGFGIRWWWPCRMSLGVFLSLLYFGRVWEGCWLCVCHRWPLLCWGRFPLCLHPGEFFFYHKWVLNFDKSFFCIYWDDHMLFILQFVNMVYHIDWFAYIEESLHPWDKSHLIVVYDPFNVLLDSVC